MRVRVEVEASDGSHATVLDLTFTEEPNWEAVKWLLSNLWNAERLIKKFVEAQAEEEEETKCELCGQSAVEYKIYLNDGTVLRRCRSCLERLKKMGIQLQYMPLNEQTEEDEEE